MPNSSKKGGAPSPAGGAYGASESDDSDSPQNKDGTAKDLLDGSEPSNSPERSRLFLRWSYQGHEDRGPEGTGSVFGQEILNPDDGGDSDDSYEVSSPSESADVYPEDFPGSADEQVSHRRSARPLHSVAGQVLVATNSMQDQRFDRSVILICSHNDQGAMGLVLNRLSHSVSADEIMSQLGITSCAVPKEKVRIFAGGPVETGRGFVLHSSDYVRRGTVDLSEGICMTATVDVVRDITAGFGPARHMLVLGYAGWGRGQLDGELRQNVWLHTKVSQDLLFHTPPAERWERALESTRIDMDRLSTYVGQS